jgi:ParB family chromosome partitioning protein
MTETHTIPLNKLLAWEGNVRQTEPDKNLDELAASITAHGLLQSLVVRKDKRGKYAVVAGRRRLLALNELVKAGKIEAEQGVPCTVIGNNADATEISLVENVQREAMHPADEFEAFNTLVENGMPIADVAARFGVTETVVQRRLKLARVSPVLLNAYRQGEMTLQHVMALTVTDDHAAQERAWNGLADWQKEDPETLRDALAEGETTANDPRVKFVTLEAYEKAGGAIRRDLFTEDDHGIFVEDIALLQSLFMRKLEDTANAVREEGWKWVTFRPSFDYDEWKHCERMFPEQVPLTEDGEAELLRLTEERDALWEVEEPDAVQEARFEELSERLDELENRPDFWPRETLAIGGAVVSLDHGGKVKITAGLVKPEDAPTKPRRTKAENSDQSEASPFAASLIESLTAQRSAALAAALLERPDIALATAVHAVAAQVFYAQRQSGMTLQIGVNRQSLHRVEDSRAHRVIEDAGEKWAAILPANPEALFDWCLAQSKEKLLELLALSVARSVNVVRLKTERGESERFRHADRLAEALNLDMTQWFTPNAGNYFGKVSKGQIVDALREVKGAEAPAWSSMKKAELASLAEREIAGTGWLPEPLRGRVADTEAAA